MYKAAEEFPMVFVNILLQLTVGFFFYALLPWTMIVCGQKSRKTPPVTQSMMTTMLPVPNRPVGPCAPVPAQAQKTAFGNSLLVKSASKRVEKTCTDESVSLMSLSTSTLSRASYRKRLIPFERLAPNVSGACSRFVAFAKSQFLKEEKKDDGARKDEKQKEVDELKSKSIEDKKEVKKADGEAKAKAKTEEDGGGYEACPDMTPEQLEKICKEGQ
uniref:Uncharacterized protein n=1 Tax=Steinernema glaseri TaxID=37863 RepID=A0A1I7YIM9_9BILA